MKSGDATRADAEVRLRRARHGVISFFTADEDMGENYDCVSVLLREHKALPDTYVADTFDGGSTTLRDGERADYRLSTSANIHLSDVTRRFNFHRIQR